MIKSREVALSILEEIQNNNAYGNLAISFLLDKHKTLDSRERGFITELTNGTLRNIIYIDYIIDVFASTPYSKRNTVIQNILRLAVYQIMFLNVKPHAACNEAVQCAKKRGLGGLSGFVNGVLRNIVRNKNCIKLPDKEKDSLKYLSVKYSHPLWVLEKWVKSYGFEFTEKMCAKNNEAPDVTIRVNTIKTKEDDLIKLLEAEGISVVKSQYLPNCLHIKGAGAIKNVAAHKSGYFHVQDAASQLAAAIVNPNPGSNVLDLCAAPGGKSFTCAYLMENSGVIHSRDIYTHKIKLIKEGANRLDISIINAKKRDAAIIDDSLVNKMDCVIVDAPCSGLGLIRKKPDIRLNKTNGDIASLQKLQRNILTAGAAYVKKGGSLIYSTCTITDEENISNTNWFLNNFDFTKDDVSGSVCSILKPSVKDGCLSLFPHIHNTDGFFICKFIKRS